MTSRSLAVKTLDLVDTYAKDGAFLTASYYADEAIEAIRVWKTELLRQAMLREVQERDAKSSRRRS